MYVNHFKCFQKFQVIALCIVVCKDFSPTAPVTIGDNPAKQKTLDSQKHMEFIKKQNI